MQLCWRSEFWDLQILNTFQRCKSIWTRCRGKLKEKSKSWARKVGTTERNRGLSYQTRCCIIGCFIFAIANRIGDSVSLGAVSDLAPTTTSNQSTENEPASNGLKWRGSDQSEKRACRKIDESMTFAVWERMKRGQSQKSQRSRNGARGSLCIMDLA